MANHKEHRQDVKKHQFWKAHVEAWRRSGLSQNEYCRQNTLKKNQLGYWKNKFAHNTSVVNFVPVPIHSQSPQLDIGNSISGITICLKKERRIEVDNNFSSETLANVLSVLESQP